MGPRRHDAGRNRAAQAGFVIKRSAGRIAAAFDRYPFNSPWVRGLVGRYWLQAWFAIETFLALIQAAMDTRYIFFDARLYIAATRAWLDGGDPWQVQIAGNYFAAPPPTLLPLVPFALLPGDLGWLAIALVVAAGAVASVRLLGLPWWWLLFPPLVQSVISGNVQALLVPLILVGAGPIAALLKVYAAVPLVILGRWRSLVVLAAILLVTAPILPWQAFLSDIDTIGARLSSQNENGLPNLVLLAIAPAVAVALWVVGRERAAWLAVPAIWPAQQFYYGTLVMPTRSKIAAAIVAFPVAGSGAAALFVVAALTWREHHSGKAVSNQRPVPER
jgi:hypothetical protein